MDPLQYAEEFYFGQPRVPATYLDNQDYVFGATAKLEKILPVVAAKGHRLIAVVNSPGAALIGDDLERFISTAGLPVPCLAMESTGFSDRLVPFLKSQLGIASVAPIKGAPWGADQIRQWIEGICQALALEATPALDAIDRTRQRAYGILSRFNSLTGLPRGATFALIAEGSIALPLTRWLYEYLGMVPVGVAVQPDLVFGGEGVIGRFRTGAIPAGGINIALPGNGSIEVIDRCHLGATGTLWLLERILNELLEG